MNRSIQFIVCVLAILCQNINSAVAQTRSYDGVISVVPVQLEQRGKSVYYIYRSMVMEMRPFFVVPPTAVTFIFPSPRAEITAPSETSRSALVTGR